MKKKITWVTYDCFLDCDISLILELKKYYHITWIILSPLYENRFKKEDFLDNPNFKGVEIQFIVMNFRLRRPLTYLFWFKLGKHINKTSFDLLYFNGDATVFNLPMIWSFDKKKLIFAIHEGLITTDNKNQLRMINLARSLTMPYIRYFNFFSNSQAQHFSKKFSNNRKFVIPLALKNFGSFDEQRNKEEIVFFNFGTILPKKNIDILIEAACNIYEQGFKGFKVAIHGSCSDWSFYLEKIRYPEIFICDIRFIDNTEIKTLFNRYHYLVLPYKTASQSGPLKIAFNYDVPVIVSDQPGFLDEVIEGINGNIFKTGDIKSLESVMIELILSHENYEMKRKKMKNFTKENFSVEVIGVKYKNMFEEVMIKNEN